MRRRLVVLASGSGTNLQAVLDATDACAIDASVVAVLSNKPEAYALERARNAGVPCLALPREPGEDRRAYDRRLVGHVRDACPDFVVLAGWMLLLSSDFLDHVGCPVVNLHPALPGDLPGVGSIERAHAEALAGARTRSGVMVHFVPDEGVDDGPVIATIEVSVGPTDSLEDFATRMHQAEHRLLVEALRGLCSTAPDTPTRRGDVPDGQ